MAETLFKIDRLGNREKNKDFKFASKEGLLIVSLLLFIVYAVWYKIFEFYYYDNFIRWLFIFMAFSIVIFVTMVLLLITGFIVLWKDRDYIMKHEGFGSIFFLIGSIILITIPFAWAGGVINFQDHLAQNTIIFIILGSIFCIIGSFILARTGGFFSVWLIGIAIYLIISFHEGFKFFVDSDKVGSYNDFLGIIGSYFMVAGFILFIYHDVKFFYLSRIIKRGNKYRREKKYKNALECFKKTLKIYPLFTTALNNMGNVYFNMGKADEAIKCYQRALNINPNYGNAKKNLKVVSKKLKKTVL